MEAKPKRSAYQPYIPVHRRNKAAVEETTSAPTSPRSTHKEEIEVKRRGRGQFRAPSSEDVNSTSTSTSSSIDFDKTTDSPIEEKPMNELIRKVERLSTETKEEKDDWEEDWEENIEVVTSKAKPEPIEKKTKASVKPSIPEDDELTTVLDCYDFPNSFKTHHLQDMFREYESMKGGYNIKWMDDTRALIIFEHPFTAKKAYIDNLNSPFIKIRPYKGQIDKRSSGPVPRRPATTDMVARRLVHGALGVRTVKTPEQREAERELLKQAKEQRQAQRKNTQSRQKEIASAFDE